MLERLHGHGSFKVTPSARAMHAATGYHQYPAVRRAEWRYAGSDATITAKGQTMSVCAEIICTEAIIVYARLALYSSLSGKYGGKERGLMCLCDTSSTGKIGYFESLARYHIPQRGPAAASPLMIDPRR